MNTRHELTGLALAVFVVIPGIYGQALSIAGDMSLRGPVGWSPDWPGGLALTATVRAIFPDDIAGFLPRRIFDMRTHVNPGGQGMNMNYERLAK